MARSICWGCGCLLFETCTVVAELLTLWPLPCEPGRNAPERATPEAGGGAWYIGWFVFWCLLLPLPLPMAAPALIASFCCCRCMMAETGVGSNGSEEAVVDRRD